MDNKFLESINQKNCLKKLEIHVTLRNSMATKLYQDITNGECNIIAEKCIKFGYSKKDVDKILNDKE